MKIKIIAGTMVALSFSLMSCSDFLTEDPRGKLTPENFFSTQDELNMSIYALYQKVNLSQVYTNMQLPQWQGDDITIRGATNSLPQKWTSLPQQTTTRVSKMRGTCIMPL